MRVKEALATAAGKAAASYLEGCGFRILDRDWRCDGEIPGWHAIVGGVSGWGAGEDFAAKRSWVADSWPWAELAPVIATGLTRPFLNGVRIFIGQGDPHEPSATALAAMNWPRTAQMSTAKVFLVLVHPENTRDG